MLELASGLPFGSRALRSFPPVSAHMPACLTARWFFFVKSLGTTPCRVSSPMLRSIRVNPHVCPRVCLSVCIPCTGLRSVVPARGVVEDDISSCLVDMYAQRYVLSLRQAIHARLPACLRACSCMKNSGHLRDAKYLASRRVYK